MATWQTVRASFLGCQCTLHRSGPDSGRPIVALHGFTGSGLDFDALADRIGWARWIAPDLPGHGGSPSAGADFARAAAIVREVGAAESRSERPVLLGYSMGGRVALRAALDAPEAWSALVLIGATPGIEGESERAARAAADDALARRLESIGTAAFLREWSSRPLIATQASIEVRYAAPMRARRLASAPGGWAAALRGYGTGRMGALWGELGALRPRALLLAGGLDPKFAAIAARAARAAPRAEAREVEGAGHAAHLEAPGAVARAIERFLRGDEEGEKDE